MPPTPTSCRRYSSPSEKHRRSRACEMLTRTAASYAFVPRAAVRNTGRSDTPRHPRKVWELQTRSAAQRLLRNEVLRAFGRCITSGRSSSSLSSRFCIRDRSGRESAAKRFNSLTEELATFGPSPSRRKRGQTQTWPTGRKTSCLVSPAFGIGGHRRRKESRRCE